MKNKRLNLRRTLAGFIFLASASVNAQNVPVATGEFTPDWDNLAKWECPEWYQDVKFGIWAHWDPQCQAAGGDWYARGMYFKGSANYNWHGSLCAQHRLRV